LVSHRQPIHRQITDKLRQRIAAGKYGEEGLPPELNLMDEFGVSRHTVRTALQKLVNDGLIERRAGSGTRVTPRATGGVWVVGSLDDLIGEYAPHQFLTLSAQVEPASRFPAIASLFGVSRKGNVFHILRLLTASDLPYALVNVFSPAELAATVPASEIGAKPLIDLVEGYGKVRPRRARQIATAAAADQQTSRQLGVPAGAPVLVLHRTYFDGDGRPLVHAELSCRPDRYQQTVDFLHEAKVQEPEPK
jgi:GntR family transcriptional regulator